ncbi:hypothetical protein ACN6MY_19465 [Peribacillus sp. B-H-3]|uniref:hypothetical protein n=1 Tax=Peribacillus sp. B-H-3 TaxID=3400420 RepID=UPI003B01E8FE
MKDFTAEGDPYFGGAYYTGWLEVYSNGFYAKVEEFCFDNHTLKQFYNAIKKLIVMEDNKASFKSESNELKIALDLELNGNIMLDVSFKDKHSDDKFTCNIGYYDSIRDPFTLQSDLSNMPCYKVNKYGCLFFLVLILP